MKIRDALREQVRRHAGRTAQSSAGIIDSQTVKTPEKRGFVSMMQARRSKERERHILVDTLGPLLMVVVHVGNLQDRDGALSVLARAQDNFPTLRLI